MVMNSPLNPTGTVIDKEVLRGIAQAIVDENTRRGDARPCMLMWDAVYWQLTKDEHPFYSPVQLVPEIAPYVVHIDAISKNFSATGLRVGWAVLPPYLQTKMAVIGHMGAWAARPGSRRRRCSTTSRPSPSTTDGSRRRSMHVSTPCTTASWP